MIRFVLFIFIAALCSAASAQLEVKAPEHVPLNSLVYITLQKGSYDTVDLEVWAGETEIKYEEIVGSSDGSKTFVFTGPAGDYVIRAFGWSTGQKPEKYRGKIVIGGDVPAPVPDVLDGLAEISRSKALKVFSVGRTEEAAKIAEAYLSAASKAAAIPGVTAKDMTESVRESLASLDDSARKSWGEWANAITAELNKLPPDKEKYIEAYRQIAKGLEGVK
jgi:hypothetical protein